MFCHQRRAAGCVAGVSCGLWAQGRYGGFPTDRLPATPGLEGAPHSVVRSARPRGSERTALSARLHSAVPHALVPHIIKSVYLRHALLQSGRGVVVACPGRRSPSRRRERPSRS